MAYGTCAVDGCENYGPLKRTWCGKHYLRWYRNGGTPPPEGRRGSSSNTIGCSIDGCERRHYSRGFCNPHYQRWLRHGDPLVVQPGAFKGDAVGYSAVHERLNRTRGHASEYQCAHCPDAAVDWAYDGMCPDEKYDERHGRMLAYSTDPTRYMPLCRRCHSIYDGNVPVKKES